ncbi:uncharacterized protein BJ171DRAFT_507995 [Polychytrium aggregatum]|uniref:uncharacterized protein n=1 Tax=Polychytrium aggregatum TaxID=110093 RepID=UPI0022FDEF9D|nr:uncharacterized protein BJ171DRAFT_507995 [Polychytrium aggregatum]KAI9203796.1 hypothetical protein BJ171DRAFT_507995 [Polychytrium aggregatum]
MSASPPSVSASPSSSLSQPPLLPSQAAAADPVAQRLSQLTAQLSDRLSKAEETIIQLHSVTSSLKEQVKTFKPKAPAAQAVPDSPLDQVRSENMVLKQTVKQYEQAIELIMTQFRKQTAFVVAEKAAVREQVQAMLDEMQTEIHTLQSEKALLEADLCRAHTAIREALSQDCDLDMAAASQALLRENEALRELLALKQPEQSV